MSCIQSTQLDGAEGPAFTSWILTVVSGEDKNGSDPGEFEYGSNQTGDLQLSVDIAPSKEILYKLTATVSNTSIGPIFDSPDCNDNVNEDGTGVQMPDYNISILKDVNTNRYLAGGELTYTIKVANTGDGTANNIRIFDDLGAITVTDIYGKQILAYTDWKVTATSIHIDGSATITTSTGINGTLEKPTNFDVFATIEANTIITYRITVHVAATAMGNIQNTITVNNNLEANRLIYPYDPRVSFEKTALANDLINGTNTAGYSKGSTVVTYKLVIENQKEAGFASNVKLIDNLTDIKAALLHSGKKVPVFSNWTTTVESEPLDSSTIHAKLQKKIINAIQTSLPADGENLDITLTIPPNTRITYTITADIDRSITDDIIWGAFTNIATLDLGDTYGKLTSDDSISPKPPRITVFKSSKDESFVIGEEVSFNIYVFNSGTGYANNVTVKDDIEALGIFESGWTLEGGIDNHVDTGSKFDTTNTLQNGEDINTVVDIDPDDKSSKYDGYGYVTYTITGTVKSDYDADDISNTAEIYDPITNTHHSSTASIGRNNPIDKLNISILKTADRAQMIPGKALIYSIMIQNNGSVTEEHLTVTDMITDIIGVLANEKGGSYNNLLEQSPFDYWQIKLPDDSEFDSEIHHDDFIYPPKGSSINLTLEEDQTKTFKIKVHVRDNFVGIMKEDTLNNIISNEAFVYKNYSEAGELSQVSLHEIHLAGNHLEITKSIFINDKESNFYKPGDTLSYFIEYASSTGYSNDTIVQENITGITVSLMDGSTGSPFSDGLFTVTVIKDDEHGKKGTTDGVKDGVVADNQNIDTIIDIADGDTVTYKIEGIIDSNAVGDIIIGNTVIEQEEPHLSFIKTTVEKNYFPGQQLHYVLSIKNTGGGNAYKIPVLDEISAIEVALLNEKDGAAFKPDWKITALITPENPDIHSDTGSFNDGEDLDTLFSLAPQSTLQYFIETIVNPQAIGDIINQLSVNGDKVSNISTAGTQKFTVTKTIIAYYDTDGETKLSTGLKGYKPDGYIEYKISIVNDENVNLNHVSILDEISKIKTSCYSTDDGKTDTCQPFDTWTISADQDNSGLTTSGSVTDNEDISTFFNLAAAGAATDGKSQLSYTIRAHIKENVVGKFINEVIINSQYKTDSPTSIMLPQNLKKTHEAWQNDSKEIKTLYDHTPDGELVTYHLRIENTGNGLIYGKPLTEFFSKVTAKMAQRVSNQTDNDPKAVYANWSLDVLKSDESMTSIGGFVGGDNKDINIPYLSIAPGGWIDFIMHSTIDENTLSTIKIEPLYNGISIDGSQIAPDGDEIEVQKYIQSIGGRPYTGASSSLGENDYYIPGDEVVYKIIVNNTTKVWFDNALIRDLLSNVKTDILDGNRKSAFSEFYITDEISEGINDKVDTFMPYYDDKGDLSLDNSSRVDIAPGEKITFTVRALIRTDAIGYIDENKADAGTNSSTTPAIPPAPSNIIFTKTLLSTTADSRQCNLPSTTGKGCNYNPGGQVVYQIEINNDGEGIARDITVQDFISTIETTEHITAFSSSNVHITDEPDSDRYSISGNFNGDVDLDATIDLMAGEHIVFKIQGVVSLDATGDILNTAQINGDDSNEILLNSGSSTIRASKTASIEKYVPGQEVTYTIKIANTSERNIKISIEDQISSFKVKTADGTMKTAIQDGWTIASTVISEASLDPQTTYTDISSLPKSGDIDTTIKLSAAQSDSNVTEIEIKITGNIRNDAIGKFTNIATINNKPYNLNIGYIVPTEGKLVVIKQTSDPTHTYQPNESLGFDVRVSNEGDGYLSNVTISDLVSSIKSDFSGELLPGQVFDQWDPLKIDIISEGSPLSEQIGSVVNDKNGYVVKYNIAPKETLKLHFEAEVNEKTMDSIINTVKVTKNNGEKQEASAQYDPEKVTLSLTEIVDRDEYDAGDTLTYTITVTNETNAWAKQVHITDLFSSIESSTIDDTTRAAFDLDTLDIKSISSSGNTIIPTTHTGDIDGYIDIAPNDILTITASAQLYENIHGEVTNTVSIGYKGAILMEKVTSIARLPGIIFTKTAPVSIYIPGERSEYIVTLKNNNNSYAKDIHLTDAISKLTVETIDGKTEESAFEQWTITSDSDDSKTNIAPFDPNSDLDMMITLAPFATVTFTISGEINKKAIGIITNTAFLIFEDKTESKEATLSPEKQDVTFTKTVDNGKKEGIYSANKEASFFLTLDNNANSFAQNIHIIDLMNKLMVTTLSGNEEVAFNTFDITYKISNDIYSTSIIDVIKNTDSLETNIDLAPNASIVFTLKGLVNANAVGEIVNTATMTKNGIDTVETALLQTEKVILVVTKKANKPEYNNTDTKIIYTLNAYNRGSIDVSGVLLTDKITQLQNKNGDPLFTNWTTTIKEMPSGVIIATQKNSDLSSTQTLKAYAENSFVITVEGNIGQNLNDDITNTFSALTPDGDKASDSVTIHVKKSSNNNGQLLITKRALKDSIKVGEVVEYEVIIENNNVTSFNDVILEDRYPAGFQYVPDSVEMTHSGADGIFDTGDDIITYTDPSIRDVLSFNIGDLLVNTSQDSSINEKVRVRYLLRASVGMTFGKYINTAYALSSVSATSSGTLNIISNLSSASVEIAPDKVFDTASIIGKVFEDHNQDGYQADATATDITIHVDLPSNVYVKNSTIVTRNNKVLSHTSIINDIQIDRLMGVSLNRTLFESNKIILQFSTLTPQYFAFDISTDAGSHISFSKDNDIKVHNSGAKAKGLSAENLNVTRTLFQDGQTYLWEIVVENVGIYEDGIPGIKLLTVDGIIIETDEYGRYHLPDQWVLNKKGAQTLVKLDTDSLPANMHVISANPKVLRVSPNKLTKFNFSVHKI